MESNRLNNILSEEAVVEALMLVYHTNGDGTKVYRNKDGKLHRIHGPAVIYENGAEFWWKDGMLHREDGPACFWPYDDGDEEYWNKNGKFHRESNTLKEYVNGTKEFWINGNSYTEDEFTQWQKDNGIKPIE